MFTEHILFRVSKKKLQHSRRGIPFDPLIFGRSSIFFKHIQGCVLFLFFFFSTSAFVPLRQDVEVFGHM